MQAKTRYKAWLQAACPKAFHSKRRPPLMVGVYEEHLADPARPPCATDAVVQWALARWCRHWRYRRSVRWRMRRRALDGTKLEQVSEAQAAQTRSLQVRCQRAQRCINDIVSDRRVVAGASRGAPERVFSPEGVRL